MVHNCQKLPKIIQLITPGLFSKVGKSSLVTKYAISNQPFFFTKHFLFFQEFEFSRCLSPEEDCYGICMEGYKPCNVNTAISICRPVEECKNLEDEDSAITSTTTIRTTNDRMTTGIPADSNECTNTELPCKGLFLRKLYICHTLSFKLTSGLEKVDRCHLDRFYLYPRIH